MQILINKAGRKVKLTKRELDLLNNSKALLAELSLSGGGELGQEADEAAASISNVLKELTAASLEVV